MSNTAKFYTKVFFLLFVNIFLIRMQERFTLRKLRSKILLILDVLAKQNDVVLLCLPANTPHYLQSLDRCFLNN